MSNLVITEVSGPFSNEQFDEIARILHSKRSSAEIEAEIDRIITVAQEADPSGSGRTHRVRCEKCKCGQSVALCYEEVHNFDTGEWQRVGIKGVVQCGGLRQIGTCFGALMGWLSGR